MANPQDNATYEDQFRRQYGEYGTKFRIWPLTPVQNSGMVVWPCLVLSVR